MAKVIISLNGKIWTVIVVFVIQFYTIHNNKAKMGVKTNWKDKSLINLKGTWEKIVMTLSYEKKIC